MNFLRLFGLLLSILSLSLCTQASEENPYYHVIRSNLKAFEGEFEGSLEDLIKAMESFPEDAYLKYLAAERLAQKQDFDKALAFVNEALKLKSKWYPAKLLKGQILEAQGEFEKAGLLFEELRKQNPDKEEGYFQLAQNLVHREKYHQAISVLNAWLAKEPNSITTLYYIATLQNVYLKNTSQALVTYQKLLKLDSDNIRVRIQMAQIYLKEGKKEAALKEFLAIEAQYPSDLSIKLQIASLYQELGNLEKAIAKLHEILKANPESDRIHYFLGLLHVKLNQQEKALTHLENVSPASNLYKEAILQKALVYKDSRQFEKGIAVLKEAIRKQAKVSQFYQFLSVLWEDKNEMDKAVQALKQGIKKVPEDEELYFSLGVLYDKRNQKEESVQMMQKVLEINPKNASAMNYIGYTYAEKGENLEEAEKLILKALELKPGDGYITDSLGWVYFQQGHLKKALFHLEKAYKVLPDEPVIIEHLGDIYLKMGQKGKAIQFFKKSLEFGKKKEKPNLEEIKRVEEKLQTLQH